MPDRKAWLRGVCVPLLLVLSACGGGGGDDGGTTGSLKVSVGDAPVDDASAVVVKFSGIEIKPSGSDPVSFDFDEDQSVDLLDTVGGEAFVLLGDTELAAGDYEWIRLSVITSKDSLDSYIELIDGSVYPLYVPSGSESGLKLNTPFTVPVGGALALVVHFDLRHSIVKPSGQDAYYLKPVLRLVDESEIGAVAGSLAPELLADPECTSDANTGAGAAVYLYEGAGVIPDDAGSDTPPLASSGVSLNTETGRYDYFIAYLPAADYTVAYTCQASDDDPEADDDLLFPQAADAPVIAGATTVVDFDPL